MKPRPYTIMIKKNNGGVDIGGEISGNTVIIQVDHFTMFALMVAVDPVVTKTIKPAEGGTVALGEEAVLEIPAGALAGSSPVEVKIERLSKPLISAGRLQDNSRGIRIQRGRSAPI